MATTIPARELRNNYAQIIKRVRAGERITVATDGVPAIDLVPHVPRVTPPRFRPADQLPVWSPLGDQASMAWLADVRELDQQFDQTVTDPWERG
ncbi:type II toxin-antitoxin system Phd/YefM family antitoxin [Flexivirga caeni]|uniref:Type II toxin-antitoxin system prevent-host-death family antitoxin n=1 Tax=Flexivirga caeni TaxID=2294115 RepID=A0A3M9M922_9MICO|nr:type II toxin-antitoxin system prevent-host-death family antitoxin [Flexivirga caeni]RNI21687.1 type II toxin-antitoxin system prevent-host-death family antitoxin [Flexivirga caeni]